MADASFLNHHNTVQILRKIYEEGLISRTEISRQLKTSIPTITRIVDQLINEKIVSDRGSGSSTGGRRPALLSLDDEESYIIGIDLAPHFMYGVIANINAELVSSFKLPTFTDQKFEYIMERTYNIISNLIVSSAISEDRILGIGIAITGIIDREHNIMEFSPHFKWRKIDVVKELRKYTSIPIVFDNLSRVMAVGELYFGVGKKHRNFICIKVGEGIGVGIIIDKQPFFGAHGVSGEFGHTITDYNNINKCVCGKKGCIETFASLHGIKNRLIEILDSGKQTSLFDACKKDPENLTFAILAEEKKSGDRIANELAINMINTLSFGISNLINLFDPEIIVIGGDLINGGKEFLQAIRSIVYDRAITSFAAKTDIQWGSFGAEEMVMGGIALVLDKVLKREIVRVQGTSRVVTPPL